MCDEHLSVDQLCAALTPRLRQTFIEPLCVSALNTPMAQASARVFLRVLRDAMFGARGGSNLLLPRTDLGALFPEAAARWLVAQGAQVRLGQRVGALQRERSQWRVQCDEGDAGTDPAGKVFDRIVVATSAPNAAQLLTKSAQAATDNVADTWHRWAGQAAQLTHEAITTVYAQALRTAGFIGTHAPPARAHTKGRQAAGPLLSAPMLALPSDARTPAQFVFDRDAIARDAEASDLLSFVVSTSQGDRSALEAAITAQARHQLGLAVMPLLTVTDKRATFACTPGLQRPAAHIAPGLIAVGDYIDGPYPATLEGAVLSAHAVDMWA